MSNNQLLFRYTDIPALIGILKNRAITLLPPSTWDDRNDRYLMEAYKREKKLKTLLALCFSQARQTYHHWKVFAPGNSGVAIRFDRDELLEALPKNGTISSSVTYMTDRKLQSSQIDVNELPFRKRWAFYDEKEFRIVFFSKTKDLLIKNFSIELSTIKHIVINPWLPRQLFNSTRETLLSIEGCDRLDIRQSKLIDSPLWKDYAGKYVLNN